MRSVWESVTNEPKTRKSKAPVPVIAPMQRLLDQYRASRGNPSSGPIFGTMNRTPLSFLVDGTVLSENSESRV